MYEELKLKEFINKKAEVKFCSPEDNLRIAKSLMLLNDFSQIPVVEKGKVIGCITWKSIGRSTSMSKLNDNKVIGFMDTSPPLLNLEQSFLDHIKEIAENEYILLIDESFMLKGILTTYDITLRFDQFINPFVRIGFIENELRQIIISTGIQYKKSPTEFMFSDYEKFIDKHWDILPFKFLEKDVFLTKLSNIRGIRNRTAHYNPNRANEYELYLLTSFHKLLVDIKSNYQLENNLKKN